MGLGSLRYRDSDSSFCPEEIESLRFCQGIDISKRHPIVTLIEAVFEDPTFSSLLLRTITETYYKVPILANVFLQPTA